MNEYAFVGKRIPRIDALEKARGEAIFVDDIQLPDMLYGKILRSPHPHALISGIDTSQAERLPGVVAIVTGDDLPEVQDNTRPIFAHGKARFAGEAVAAVAAVDLTAAEEALDNIKVQYQVLPPVLDPIQAMEPDSPFVHDEAENPSNVYLHVERSRGDVEQGFAEADFIFEDTFKTTIIHQGYIEPHGAVAQVDSSGKVTVWTTTQSQFSIRASLARKLRLPMTKVRVIPTEIGGGFGGKNDPIVEPICALLAQKAKRPVKIVLTREEELTSTLPADACIAEIKTGVKKDGTITARKVRLIMDSGAYASSSVELSSLKVLGPYRIPNFKVDGYAVYTNKTNPGALRAPGTPQVAFASESQMDIIAEKLGIDPVELRMRNLLETGDIGPNGEPMPKIGFKETLQALVDRVGWKKGAQKEKNRGWGIACGEWTNAVAASSAYVTINEDGTAKILSGSINLTGSSTSLAQIAAEELGVPVDRVIVVTGDTDLVPYVDGNWGSRTVYSMGTAVRRAAADARRRLFEMAAEQLEAKTEELEARDRQIRVKGDPGRAIPISVLASMSLTQEGGPIVGRGSLATLPQSPALSAQFAEVEVDPETGRVRVLRLVAAQDVGFAINPLSVEGQIQGGAAQGLGWGLMEGVIYENGRVVNAGFLDYKMPTACDVPPIEPVIVEVASEAGPYGAKGVGEPPIVPTSAAIANAIYDAVGARIKELPITPEKVFRALREKA
ncbi:MAG: xanthine dehydrogenase family protein molybdopterin-binding subunit [bacterium]